MGLSHPSCAPCPLSSATASSALRDRGLLVPILEMRTLEVKEVTAPGDKWLSSRWDGIHTWSLLS